MVVLHGWKVDDDHITVPDIVVGMPHVGRNIHNASVSLGKHDAADFTMRRTHGPRVVENEFHFPGQDRISIFVPRMEPPAFDDSRSNGKCVRVDKWVGVKVPAWIEKFRDRPTAIGMSHKAANDDSLRQPPNWLAGRGHGAVVLRCLGEHSAEQRKRMIPVKTAV